MTWNAETSLTVRIVDTPEHIDYARRHDLTIEEVRACPIFAHMSDEEAREVIETLKALTKIAHDFYKKGWDKP
jgi:hypothetical protein